MAIPFNPLKLSLIERLLSDLGDLSMSKWLAFYAGICFFINVGWILGLTTYVTLYNHKLPPAEDVLAWAQFQKPMVEFGALMYSAGKVLGIFGGYVQKKLAARGVLPEEKGGGT